MNTPERPQHPWVQTKSDGKTLRCPLYYEVVGVICVVLMASAYLVYTNVLTKLPLSVSFFWFSLFAAFVAFAYPEDPTSALLLRHIPWQTRRRILWPTPPFRAWKKSLHVGFPMLFLVLATTAYCFYFPFLIWTLSRGQKGVVITVLLIFQLSPIFKVVVGRIVTKDTCENWTAYAVGAILTVLGVFLYKEGLRKFEGIPRFDAVALGACLALLFDVVYVVARQYYLFIQRPKTDPLSVMRSVYVGTTLLTFLWLVFDPFPFVLPSLEQFVALIYLGLIPTAFGGIIGARVMHKKGIAYMESVASLRPLFAALLSIIIPFSWFRQELPSLTLPVVAGIIFAVIGVLVIWRIARPIPASQKEG